MTARIRLNEKKGIFFLILFTALSIYSWLLKADVLPGALEDLSFSFELIPIKSHILSTGSFKYLLLKNQ
jgi:hypothetical protein